MAITPYDPEQYLESTVRGLHDYLADGFNNAVRDDTNAPVGLEIYEIVPEFPGPNLDAGKVPMSKTIIHFELDDDTPRPVGLGDNVFSTLYSAVDHTVQAQDAAMIMLNFDVGIWTADRDGGLTQRMRARRVLHQLLGMPHSIEALRSATDGGDGGLEIRSFQGGRFIQDRIGDVRVYRMVDCSLMLRVFSRTPLNEITPTPSIEDIVQSPGLTILG